MAGTPPPAFPTERFVTFVGALNPPITNNLRVQLANLIYQNATKVTLLFSSSGGSTDEAFPLFTYFRALPYELTIHGIGPVSSAAIPVFLSVDRSHRIVSKNARFLFHDYVMNYVNQNGPIDRTLIKGQQLILDDAVRWAKEIVKAETHLTDRDFETMKLFEEPIMIDANEAIKIGMASTIAEPTVPFGSQPLIVL
jgi:ATP-dependent protease ClpP protease subunit